MRGCKIIAWAEVELININGLKSSSFNIFAYNLKK